MVKFFDGRYGENDGGVIVKLTEGRYSENLVKYKRGVMVLVACF
jgi:hypothetical protein